MGWSERISEHLGGDVCLHAVGQGALAVECRDTDRDTLELLSNLHHRHTVLATIAERAFMKTLGIFNKFALKSESNFCFQRVVAVSL